jgi:hypothetical protein
MPSRKEKRMDKLTVVALPEVPLSEQMHTVFGA